MFFRRRFNEDILFDHSLRFPTEGEWELAFKNKQLESAVGIEILVDRISDRGYWGQPEMGAQKVRMDYSVFEIGKQIMMKTKVWIIVRRKSECCISTCDMKIPKKMD